MDITWTNQAAKFFAQLEWEKLDVSVDMYQYMVRACSFPRHFHILQQISGTKCENNMENSKLYMLRLMFWNVRLVGRK